MSDEKLNWYKVKFLGGGERNITATSHLNAACLACEERNAPMVILLHAGIPENQRSGPIGTRGYYTPTPTQADTVVMMREGCVNGGMCLFEIPDAEVVKISH